VSPTPTVPELGVTTVVLIIGVLASPASVFPSSYAVVVAVLLPTSVNAHKILKFPEVQSDSPSVNVYVTV